MKKQDLYTLGLLYVLTLLTAFFSNQYHQLHYIVLIILFLSGIKFLSIVFQFMELKKANTFWKVLIIGYLTVFVSIVSLILT